MKKLPIMLMTLLLIAVMIAAAACDDDDDDETFAAGAEGSPVPTTAAATTPPPATTPAPPPPTTEAPATSPPATTPAPPPPTTAPPETTPPAADEVGMVVTIENLSDQYEFSSSGVFNTPVGDTDPGALSPGKSYAFSFNASPGDRLSFATMFVPSNDLFYAPAGTGVQLFDDEGVAISGDITGEILLWDAGTEVNEEPGVGANQAPRQAGPNTGADETGVIAQIADATDGYTYPAVASVISAIITPTTSDGMTTFAVNIENISTEATLAHTGGSSAVPLAPGIWVIHTAENPLFTEGEADRGEGLESIAEDGDPSILNQMVQAVTGISTPFAPGIWLVHTGDMPLFADGQMDRGDGLEALAEDGDATVLAGVLEGQTDIKTAVAFDGPILPGETKSFSFDAMAGDRLSFATMFVQSNDLFYAPGENGIELFDGGTVLIGDVSDMIYLWDAGTEANEAPGLGPNQAPRQAGPDTGEYDADTMVRLVADGFTYPAASSMISVTLALE